MKKYWLSGIAGVLLALTVIGCDEKTEPETLGGPPQIRRLTQEQYRNSIADIFGSEIEIPGRFDPDMRSQGMVALGTSTSSVTPMGFEQFDVMARAIAEQITSENQRQKYFSCEPEDRTTADRACAQTIISRYGRLLLRRSLTSDETKVWVDIASELTETSSDFYYGLKHALAGLMVSSEFLFRVEETEPVPNSKDSIRLTSYAKAQRLSFLLRNTTPDPQLLDAAENGDLHDEVLLVQQVDRLLSDNVRLEVGVRALFSDMFSFGDFSTLSKDPDVYPSFNFKTAEDAKEQTLRTISTMLLEQNRDYRELFTTRETFMTRTLGLVYLLPVSKRDDFQFMELPQNSSLTGNRAGLLTHVSFLALHSHPGRSSVTLRGKAIRELVLCQEVPSPPPNVDFTIVENTENPELKTARERVAVHNTDAVCAGCHKITDPIGLALEKFDGAGVFRQTEQGVAIDPSGELDGQPFYDAAGLGKAVAEHPGTPTCLVRRVFETGVGRRPNAAEMQWINFKTAQFAEANYQLKSLLRSLVTSDAFYRVSAVTDETETTTGTPAPAAQEN